MSPIRPENKVLYPSDWKDIRAEIMERADNRCECVGECGSPGHNPCGIEHGTLRSKAAVRADGRRATRPVTLTLAHLDHDPRNNGTSGDRPNLKAMCEACHNRYDMPTRVANRRKRLSRESGQLELPC